MKRIGLVLAVVALTVFSSCKKQNAWDLNKERASDLCRAYVTDRAELQEQLDNSPFMSYNEKHDAMYVVTKAHNNEWYSLVSTPNQGGFSVDGDAKHVYH